MRDGPDIALIGSLLGEPTRANMLMALMSGKALTAGELAREAGITPQTASSHLAKLEAGGLLHVLKQGRHRYFALADTQVADLLESLTGLAAQKGHMRLRTGPRDPALRNARLCYNHIAGTCSVQMLESMAARGFLEIDREAVAVTNNGSLFLSELGVDVMKLKSANTVLCKTCVDWSVRRYHLGGALGRALWHRIETLGWAKRDGDTRIVLFGRSGQQQFEKCFPSTSSI
ncbi:MAG: ArsR/SmtB family transcription factor [Hyphomicrobiales bacterium]